MSYISKYELFDLLNSGNKIAVNKLIYFKTLWYPSILKMNLQNGLQINDKEHTDNCLLSSLLQYSFSWSHLWYCFFLSYTKLEKKKHLGIKWRFIYYSYKHNSQRNGTLHNIVDYPFRFSSPKETDSCISVALRCISRGIFRCSISVIV